MLQIDIKKIILDHAQMTEEDRIRYALQNKIKQIENVINQKISERFEEIQSLPNMDTPEGMARKVKMMIETASEADNIFKEFNSIKSKYTSLGSSIGQAIKDELSQVVPEQKTTPPQNPANIRLGQRSTTQNLNR